MFGSYARGEAREDRDVDLGIVMEDVRMSLWKYAGMAMGLEETFDKKVDLIEIEVMHSWVLRDFEKDKIEMYIA